ncbi:hypothetical protein ACFW5I_34535 [Streptomyces sp. NPDC058818]|uniref:hypothetical protein n=1 Tax=Streptomyces sp. NPDC058818 TaxID=3346640 RepID=UPI0036CF4E61
MKYDILQALGVTLLVLGVQGTIRLLIDHGDAGLLGWMPGGFAVGVTVHLCAAGIGVVLTGWARGRARATARGH